MTNFVRILLARITAVFSLKLDVRLGFMSFAIILVGFMLHASGASARVFANLSPEPIPGGTGLLQPIPSGVESYLEGCQTLPGHNSPAFKPWISQLGSPSTISMPVAAGAPYIDLQYNYAGTTCYADSTVTENRSEILSANITRLSPSYAPLGGVPQAAGQSVILDFSSDSNHVGQTGYESPNGTPNAWEGYYTRGSNGFRYTFTSARNRPGTTTNYEIIASVVSVNYFTGGAIACVTQSHGHVDVVPPYGVGDPYGYCTSINDVENTPPMDFQVTVPTASCTVCGCPGHPACPLPPPPTFNNVPYVTASRSSINFTDNNPVTVTFSSGIQTTATGSPTASMTYTYGGDIPGPAPGIIPVSNGPHPLTPYPYTFLANTPPGTYCLVLSVTPASDSNPGSVPSSGPNGCVTISHQTLPYLYGTGSDVHAGGGVCGTTQSTGGIYGNGVSSGQYVVSLNGNIINYFGSNDPIGGQGGITAATLQNYSAVCRPDLVAVAQTYVASHPALPSQCNFNPSSAAVPGAVVYCFGNMTVSGGTLSAKTTLFATGSVTITGNVYLGGPNVGYSAQPSLGIIAGGIGISPGVGAIQILSAATTVNAYLFTNGEIDTCPGYCYSPTLKVYGFLMGNSIGFHRYGPGGGAGGVLAEQISFIPQIYLNPPTLFEGGNGESLLQNLGELPPLN